MWVEQHGTKFRIRNVVDGKKVTVEAGFPTKSVAKQRKQRLEIEQLDYGPLKHGADKVNFREWAEAWWQGHERTFGSPNTARTEGGRFKKHVLGRLGHLTIGKIDATVVRSWLNQLAEPDDADYDPLGPKSIKNVHGYLYMAMQVAVGERLIRANPCGNSKLPRWEPAKPRFLSKAELGEVLSKIPAKWRPLATFIAGTGCRAGEAIGLRQRRVDVLGAKVRFEAQMRYEDGKWVDAPLKTKASRRTVGVPPKLVKVLAELVSVDEDEFVFLNDGGEPVRYQTFRQAWKKALDGTKYQGVRIHDLRHTHASLLIAKGRPLTSIQRRLGHSSIQVTSDIYGGLLPEVEDDTTAAVEEALSEVDVGGIVGESSCESVQVEDNSGTKGTEKPQVNG